MEENYQEPTASWSKSTQWQAWGHQWKKEKKEEEKEEEKKEEKKEEEQQEEKKTKRQRRTERMNNVYNNYRIFVTNPAEAGLVLVCVSCSVSKRDLTHVSLPPCI